MPKTKVIIYQNEDGSVPLIKWLSKQSEKVQDKCIVLIELLAANGHELRRPYADYVDKGIYELRPIVKRVQYRILYCFVGRNIVLLTHGLVKTDKIPIGEIKSAIKYRDKFAQNSSEHNCEMEDKL
jgi:hypothetical protein